MIWCCEVQRRGGCGSFGSKMWWDYTTADIRVRRSSPSAPHGTETSDQRVAGRGKPGTAAFATGAAACRPPLSPRSIPTGHSPAAGGHRPARNTVTPECHLPQRPGGTGASRGCGARREEREAPRWALPSRFSGDRGWGQAAGSVPELGEALGRGPPRVNTPREGREGAALPSLRGPGLEGRGGGRRVLSARAARAQFAGRGRAAHAQGGSGWGSAAAARGVPEGRLPRGAEPGGRPGGRRHSPAASVAAGRPAGGVRGGWWWGREGGISRCRRAAARSLAGQAGTQRSAVAAHLGTPPPPGKKIIINNNHPKKPQKNPTRPALGKGWGGVQYPRRRAAGGQ